MKMSRSASVASVVAVTTMTTVWFIIRYGYDFGGSDQDEFLPYLLHLMNPDVLTADWFVQMQASSFSVRTVFAWILHALTWTGLTVEQAVLVLYAASWILLGTGIHRLALALTGNDRVGLLSIPLVLLVTSRWNPGGNDFMYGMMVPESLAWGIVLLGASLLTGGSTGSLTGRRIFVWTSGMLFGLAVWIHPLVGLQTGAITLIILTWVHLSGVFSRKMLAQWSVLWLVFTLPVVWLFRPDSSPSNARAMEILTHLRSPHHYLPEAFDPASLMLLLILVGVAAWVLWSKPEVFGSALSRQVAALACWILIGGLALSAVVLYVWPEGPLTVLQPFKLAVVLRGLAVVLVTAGLVSALRNRLPTASQGAAVAAVLGVVGVGLMVWFTPVRERALPSRQLNRIEFLAFAEAVRTHTAAPSIVVIPPDWTGFQYASHRAQYVNFKAFPFRSPEVLEWYDRLVTIGAEPLPGQAGTAWLLALTQAYGSRTASEWQSLLPRINATHAVVPESIAPLEPLFCQSGWCLTRAPTLPLP